MTTLRRSDLHDYQVRAAEHICNHPKSALHLEMGLGKTSSTLTAIVDLLNVGEIKAALVVAPRRVAEAVWKQEAEKWEHTRHLKVCILRGRKKALLERELIRPYDVFVINYEALPWLLPVLNKLFLARGRWLPFDFLAFDEVTRVKRIEGQRVRGFYALDGNSRKLIQHFPRRVGLTGTPAPNGYQDLFGQYFALDDGGSLGDVEEIFLERFFVLNPYTGKRHLAKGAKEHIQKLIAPITLTLQAKDWLDLPEYLYNDLWVDLPPKARAQYEQLEQEMFAQLDSATIEVFNAASLTAKCRQMANGCVKDTETATTHDVHDAKLEALDDIVEEAGGSPLLVSYVFRADMERVKKRYAKRMTVEYLGPGVTDRESVRIINDWNAGKVSLLQVHHQSAGHGLNLQHGGNQLVWFGLDWPLEGWLQLNARLRRQGQQKSHVIVHRILTRESVDEAVLERLSGKERDQDDLTAAMSALQDYKLRKQQ